MSAGGADLATAFGRVLRGAGLAVPPSSVAIYAQALGELGLAERDDVYWAGRATLVRRPEDVGVYDRCFASFFDRQGVTVELPRPTRTVDLVLLADDDGESDTDNDRETVELDPANTVQIRFSATELLRHKDFSDCTPEELFELHRLIDDLAPAGATRPSRRLVRSHRPTDRLDLRRTVRASLRADAEAIAIAHRRRTTTVRRLVLLVDVSGSMDAYARALIRFAHAAVVARRRVEVFALGTRLTRLTRELGARDPDRALERAAQSVVDWAGGTRLGDGLAAFNDQWGQRGMARGAVVVILSDGWDRGDPAVMAEQMARLARVAHRVVWVNPLKASSGYEPLARGMAAALPYIDHFVEGHSLDALERLAAVVAS